MRIDHAHRSAEAGIRDAPHADAAVVVWNVLYEPLDRVIGVSAFVDVFRAAFLRLVRPYVYELAFRHQSSAHVLVDEDELLALKVVRWAKSVSVSVWTVR